MTAYKAAKFIGVSQSHLKEMEEKATSVRFDRLFRIYEMSGMTESDFIHGVIEVEALACLSGPRETRGRKPDVWDDVPAVSKPKKSVKRKK